MNKQINTWCVAILLIMLLDSCSVWNTIVPKRKDNYINYNALFADDGSEAKKKLENEQQIAMNGKVRIVTINKITQDTIVEWVDPIEITGGKKLVFSTKEKLANNIDTIGQILTNQADILEPRKAVVFVPTESATNYMVRNDTLFVHASNRKMQEILLATMQNKKSMFDDKKEQTQPDKTTGRQKIKNRIKAATQKNKKQETKQTNDDQLNTIEDSIIDIPKDTAINALPTANQLASNAKIVGDMDFDMDANAEILIDEEALQQFVQLQAKQWKTFKCKAKVRLKTPSDSKFFYANFRMKKIENTWVSINLPIVGELARASATPDSLNVLDKWKDKFYYYKTTDFQSLLNIPIPYQALQDYIIGDAPLQAGNSIVGKRNGIGTAIKIIAPGMSCILTYNPDSTLKTVVVIGNANGKSFSIKHTLSDYENTTNGKLSTKRVIQVMENGKETIIQLDITKYEFEQELDFPFSVPSHFKDGNKEKLNK
jgi:Domain of unknown function (DUF4292)